jgi:hypothetical protein
VSSSRVCNWRSWFEGSRSTRATPGARAAGGSADTKTATQGTPRGASACAPPPAAHQSLRRAHARSRSPSPPPPPAALLRRCDAVSFHRKRNTKRKCTPPHPQPPACGAARGCRRPAPAAPAVWTAPSRRRQPARTRPWSVHARVARSSDGETCAALARAARRARTRTCTPCAKPASAPLPAAATAAPADVCEGIAARRAHGGARAAGSRPAAQGWETPAGVVLPTSPSSRSAKVCAVSRLAERVRKKRARRRGTRHRHLTSFFVTTLSR